MKLINKLIFSVIAFCIANNAIAQIVPTAERQALIEFYNSTGGSNWTNKTGWNVTDPNWLVNYVPTNIYGITFQNNRVKTITFENNNLSGNLPSKIGDLTAVTYIYIVGNPNLTGGIPDAISNLTSLTSLQLYSNKLTGSIPASIGNITTLQNIHLYNNQLSGPIPPEIGNLINLEFLRLDSNPNLSGTLPASFGNLTKLWTLWFSGNTINGTIPDSWGNMVSLFDFRITASQLTGGIPATFSNLKKIQTFILAGKLNQALPSNFGNFPGLITLALGKNQIPGTIPAALGNCPKLQELDLTENLLEGSIPSSFSQLQSLKTLHLPNNKLSGNLPSGWSTLTTINRVDLTNNSFSGNIPFLNATGLNGGYLKIANNKFRFIDIIDNFSNNKTRMNFVYSPQQKTDSPRTESKTVGQSISLTMCEDGILHNEDTYQWFKNGVAISGATSRIYTINSLSSADAGTYFCRSYHTKTSTPPATIDMSPLVLEREPITLNVSSCSKLQAIIKFSNCSFSKVVNSCEYVCGDRNVFPYIATDAILVEPVTYNWVFKNPQGGIISTYQGDLQSVQNSFPFTAVGNNTIEVTITEANGCVTKLEPVVVPVVSCNQACTKTNAYSPIVKNLFIKLFNHLLSKTTVPDGYVCEELMDLAPFITDPSPKIYNFIKGVNNNDNFIAFSFNNHNTTPNPYISTRDVFMEMGSLWGMNPTLVDFDASAYLSPNEYFVGGTTNSNNSNKLGIHIRHINFCPEIVPSCTYTNEKTKEVKQLFINLLQHLGTQPASSIINGYTCPQLQALAPYISDPDPKIYNFSNNGQGWLKFSFSNHTDLDVGPGAGIPYNISSLDLSLFVDANGYTPIGFISPSMTILAGSNKRHQIRHINFCPKELAIKCKNHVAIVLDESGSIDETERLQLRRQLRAFLTQQAGINFANNGNMYISLIGMSNNDDGDVTNTLPASWRDDYIPPTIITNTNLPDFIGWVDKYCNRYASPTIKGLSQGADFWRSGLETALFLASREKLKLDMVIMLTDGSQTSNLSKLKQTMLKFNNKSMHSIPQAIDTNKPHLLVFGIDSGYYVYNEETAISLPKRLDPNFALPTFKDQNESAWKEEIVVSEENLTVVDALEDTTLTSSKVVKAVSNQNSLVVTTPEGGLTSSLALSLKYLFDLANATTPANNAKFPTILNLDNGIDFTKDYCPLESFKYLGDEENDELLSLGINKANIGCPYGGGKSKCSECYSFQPEPSKMIEATKIIQAKDYILSAWVKEDFNIQVKEYTNAKIKIKYLDNSKNEISNSIFTAKGDIIDGWQRISNKFNIPVGTEYIEFELINDNDGTPVFFDDIRIFPISSSMKSFVYDPENFRLMSELDENNYATFYEYDNEGGLVRVKKETVKGIKTIQETRSGNVIKVE